LKPDDPIMNYFSIIWFKTWADLRAEASRAYIGFLWWFLEPLLYMTAFYALFGLGLRMGGEGFVYFLLCGLIPWKWFASTISNGSRAIEASTGMIHQVYLPKVILPTIVVMINSVKFLFILPLLVIFLVLSGYDPGPHYLALVAIVVLQFLLVWSLTAFSAALVPFVPDLRYVIENGMLMLMFLSGVFFEIGKLSPAIRDVLYFNPMARLIEAYRDVLMHGSWPVISDLAYVCVFSLAFCAVSWWMLNRFDRRYPKVL